ncbi:MAG: 50S ribosomal protein L24 [Candidatus Sumerlaeia bacterium]
MASKIKKGDKVIVISGKDKGVVGQVLHVFPKTQRVIVERVNFIKRHQRRRGYDRQGGIIEKEATIHVSNVMLLDKKTNQRTRVGFRLEGGEKQRVARKSNDAI